MKQESKMVEIENPFVGVKLKKIKVKKRDNNIKTGKPTKQTKKP
jgi:hypothetical protein